MEKKTFIAKYMAELMMADLEKVMQMAVKEKINEPEMISNGKEIHNK